MSGTESWKDVALRPWPAQNNGELGKDELLLQIEQLTNERGHLRDITEKSLQDDIDAGKNVPEDAVEGVERAEEEKEAPSRKERMDEIFRVQMEMAGHLE
jgi:mediator of RNA polymerase II transcription subunit 17